MKQLKRATDVARLRGKNVNELVSRAVAQAAADAEQEDLAHGIASVVSDAPIAIAAPVVTEAPVAAEAAADVAAPVEAAAPVEVAAEATPTETPAAAETPVVEGA